MHQILKSLTQFSLSFSPLAFSLFLAFDSMAFKKNLGKEAQYDTPQI